MSKLVLVSLLFVTFAAGCGEKAPAKGACIVDFDDLAGKGTACTVDVESACKAGRVPDVRPGAMGTLKMKSFAAGKTCEDEGFTAGGCGDVAIAWTFQGRCP